MLPARSKLFPVLVLSATGIAALAFAGPDQPVRPTATLAPAASAALAGGAPGGAVGAAAGTALDDGTVGADPGPGLAPELVTVTVGIEHLLVGARLGAPGPRDGGVASVALDSSVVERAADTRPLASSSRADEDAGAPASSADEPSGEGAAAAAPAAEGTADEPDEATGDATGEEDAEAADAEVGDVEVPAFVAADGDRITPERIEAFLADRGAPLAEHAETLVAAGVEHDVDPRLVVGIAIAESNGGERLPAGSYNAWGWSGSGSHGLRHWSSWEASIDDFTERLGRLYDTTAVDESFARTYCPPNWRWWLDTVTWTIGAI